MNSSETLKVTIARMKVEAKAASGRHSFETKGIADKLLEHLEKSNQLDDDGRYVMRLGCREAVTEDPMADSARRRRREAAKALRSVMGQRNFFEAGFLDEEIAISDGERAERKDRGDCDLLELKASIALRKKTAAAIKQGADEDQAIIDRHPEWEDEPHLTLDEILARDADDAAA